MTDRNFKPDSGTDLVFEDAGSTDRLRITDGGSTILYEDGGAAALTIDTDGDATLNSGNLIFGGSVKGIDTDDVIMLNNTTTGLVKLHGENYVTVADDATLGITTSVYSCLLVIGCQTGHGGLFSITHAGTVEEIKNYGSFFDVTDTDGKACIYKSASSHTTTFKNRRGSSLAFYLQFFGKVT